KATMINGAADMDSNLTWKDKGWGRVDINNSLYGRGLKFVNEEKALQTGEGQTYSYTVKDGKPLKVTLAWTDYPANPSAQKTLVNDLDLVVKGPDGEVLGNHMLARETDRTNNVENVVVAAPKAGTYTVTVKAHNVPQGPQRFALVVSGNVDGGTGQPTPPPQNPNPPADDKEAPKVAVTAPADGATVSGDVTVTVDATDNVGVSKVIYYVDGREAGTAAAAPFSFTWNSASVKDGAHSIVANAYDAKGYVGVSKAVNVTVKNAGVTGTQEMQFTGKAQVFGTVGRYYVDVKAGGTVTAAMSATGWANLSVVALDASGRQVAAGDKSGLSFTAAADGTYMIAVINSGGWGDFALKVTYPAAAGVKTTAKSGSVAVNTRRYETHAVTVSKAGALSAAVTASDARADLDLYLVDGAGRVVAQATSPNLNPETLSAKVAPGTYTLYVVVDSGTTNYQLNVVHPQ
ncbi:MAG TPA: Ig-like domain-containing protein, partial [Symbiobacteriaceae bacterium]|nr:Ig-like domain-containing protein [Symbiobacteriaceae bacterium]